MRILQSPNELSRDCHDYDTIFLAGGISNCPDWQSDVIRMLDDKLERHDILVINPRRIGDLARDTNDAVEQIKWEIAYIKYTMYFLFWFPEETVCPITLFELGKIAQMLSNEQSDYNGTDYISIGIHPNYSRKLDIETQLPYILPDIQFQYSLEDLVDDIIEKVNP